MNIKIKELEEGMIIWEGNDKILGITGFSLPEVYYEMYCKKIEGNRLDYQLVEYDYSIEEELEETMKCLKETQQELQRKDNIINELKNGIKELDNMFYETFRISQDGYFSISEWELKDFTDKINELEGDNK